MIAALLLLPCYFLGAQSEKQVYLAPLAVFGWVGAVLSLVLNYTELAIITWDWPRSGEWTFSKRLPRLARRDDWRGAFARYVASVLNAIEPGHVR